MKKLPDFPAEVFQAYARLRGSNLTQSEIGHQLRELFPEYFAEKKPHSAVAAVRTQAQNRGIDIPLARPGGAPRKIPQADTRWLDENPELVIPFSPRVLILSDLHFPLHLPEYLTRTLEVIERLQIETVVFNGDTFDNGYVGHKGIRNHWCPTRQDGIDAFRYYLVELFFQASLKRIVSICGNHDDKIFRNTDREMEFVDHWEKAMHGLDKNGVEVLSTNRYYAYMEAKQPKVAPFDGPENFRSIFTHQKEYSRIPGRVEARLATVEPANTYAGHHHHLSVGTHESDLYHTCGCGTGQDPRLAPYKNARQSTHPKWNVGFITLLHGVPERWRIFDPESWWNERLGKAEP